MEDLVETSERRPRRRRKDRNASFSGVSGLDYPKSITALTNNQKKALSAFCDNHLILHGMPGTGKTFLALHQALCAVLSGNYSKVVIIRSAVEGRRMGFLPGNQEEKMAAYEDPYIGLVNELFERDDAYGIIKLKRLIEFRSTSHNRGLTFRDTVVIVDEAQNMDDQELHTIITRLGQNSKLIICGDMLQDDLTSKRYDEKSGLRKTMTILHRLPGVVSVEFTVSDIVRSDFVREYIIARAEVESGKDHDEPVVDIQDVLDKWDPSRPTNFISPSSDT